MPVRIPWDEYEVAYLLQACIMVDNGELTRNEAISTVSNHLRQRAIAKGMTIDPIFRNENGIGMQFAALHNCLHGKTSGLSISKLFRDTVALYNSDQGSYNRILIEGGSNNMTIWQSFLKWITETQPQKRARELTNALSLANIFARKKGLLSTPLSTINNSEDIKKLHCLAKVPGSFGLQSKKTSSLVINALGMYCQYLEVYDRKPSTNKQDTSSDVVSEVTTDTESEKCEDTFLCVDFSQSSNFAHTKPTYCRYKDAEINCHGWNALYLCVVQKIYGEYQDVFPIGISLSHSARIDTGSSEGMVYPKEIANGIFLECNVSATGVVNKIRSLMDYCDINYNSIEIHYCRKEKSESESNSYESNMRVWKPRFASSVSTILSKYYPFGFRIGSPIENLRFRNYAEKDMIELPTSDDELTKEITNAGMQIDGKVFYFQSSELSYIDHYIDKCFESGARSMFFEYILENDLEWFEEHHIISEDMLKALVKRIKPTFFYSQNMIMLDKKQTEQEAIVAEILRVALTDPVIWFSDLIALLPHIPSEKLAWNLSASDNFVWISEGKYYNMACFVISSEEKASITAYVENECCRQGYASLHAIPLYGLQEQNYELTTSALYSAVYLAVLKGNYTLNGKIVTKSQSTVSIDTLLHSYCSEQERCSVDSIIEKSLEICGIPNRQHVFRALYDTMIRIDRDTFVSEKYVAFDVDSVDNLLLDIIGEQFTSIKSVASFALFPVCGVPWSHYLLESYCYRYSRCYRLNALNFNDRNAGIISHRSLSLTYNDMLIEAAARSNVELTTSSLGDYFFENGYTAKRKYAQLPEIMEKAGILREGH